MGAIPETITLYLSAPHQCPYLPDEIATSLIIDPNLQVDKEALSLFTVSGFRRSGDVIYKPHCNNCDACVSVRIPVGEYRPNRTQKRIIRKNSDLSITQTRNRFEQSHFDLYLSYQRARHPESDMCNPDPEHYRRFLVNNRYESVFYEMRLGEKLVAVSVCDVLSDGLSAIYTFFDPRLSNRSLGTFAIIQLVYEAARQDLPYVYLGYWIEKCRKMSYKTQFKSVQGLIGDFWIELK